MPKLRVEYAKSGRSKCSLTSCSKAIVKHEVRIGTAFIFPTGAEPSEDDPVTYKWRHLCCFTERQLKGAEASGELNTIEGFDDLAPADQSLIEEMKQCKLIGKNDIIGRVGDVANSRLAAELMPKKPAKSSGKSKLSSDTPDDDGAKRAPKVSGKSPAPKKAALKRMRGEPSSNKDDGGSDATDEYDVAVVKVDSSERPLCPYGKSCFRTGADHFAQYSHDDDQDKDRDSKNTNGKSETRLKAVVKGIKHSNVS